MLKACTPKVPSALRSTSRPGRVVAGALPFPVAPPPDDAPATIICATYNGAVQCTDDSGADLRGERLLQLQRLLRPVIEAPPVKAAPAQANNGVKSVPAMYRPGNVADDDDDVKAPAAPRDGTPRQTASFPGNVADAPAAAVARAPGNVDPSQPAPTVSAARTFPGNDPGADTPRAPGNVADAPRPSAVSVRAPGNVDPSQPPPSLAVTSRTPTPGNDDRSVPAAQPTAQRPQQLVPGNVADPPPAQSAANPAASSSSATAGRPASARKLIPGNIEVADLLPDGEFGKVQMEVGARNRDSKAPLSIVQLVNEKGLIPGNLPPEMGDIMHLLEQVNSNRAVHSLAYRLIPGNIPPDAPADFLQSVDLEFSPGDGKAGDAVNSLYMRLVPGNIPDDVEDVLEFLAAQERQAGGVRQGKA